MNNEGNGYERLNTYATSTNIPLLADLFTNNHIDDIGPGSCVCAVLSVISSFAIILMGKREMTALL